MKNLNFLSIDYFKTYSDIVVSKSESEFLQEKAIITNVKARYEEYVENFTDGKLIEIKDSIHEKNHPQLISCYKSKTIKVYELLAQIRDAQTLEAKSKCQYCGINKPKTIDHYLPISLYPEFAILAINLLPCCNECNKKKDNYWKENGLRGIINFYVDNIPDGQFLHGKITYRNNLPVFDLNFDFTKVTDEFANIATAHYERLELFSRYEEESAEEISEISRQLRIYSKAKKKAEIKDLLKYDSDDLKVSYGQNYWKAILRSALACSDKFIDDLI